MSRHERRRQVFRYVRTFVAAFPLLVVVGCAESRTAVEQRNKALVNRFGEAVNARDFDAVRQILAADFVRHCQATPDVVVRNSEQFIDYLKADAAVVPDSRQTLQRLVAERDFVAFQVMYEGTQEGQMGPFPPSHRKMRLDVTGMFRIANGKLAELWVTWDNLAALAQLGHFPPPPTAPRKGAA
jgi:steroid delta-isomerase-like uncharacterized protein